MTNEEANLLIELQKRTHSCVKNLDRDVKRNTALVVANGVKLDTAIDSNKKCDTRLTKIELWKATHTGEATGKVHKASRFNTKTTLICVVGVALLTLLGFWFTTVQPALNLSADMLSQFKAINGQLLELNILK